ncbi:hypothetical protein AMTRI_Chr13g91450 [Amborella trichopoda]
MGHGGGTTLPSYMLWFLFPLIPPIHTFKNSNSLSYMKKFSILLTPPSKKANSLSYVKKMVASLSSLLNHPKKMKGAHGKKRELRLWIA